MSKRNIRLTPKILFIWFFLATLAIFFSPDRITGKFQHLFTRLFSWPLSMGRSIMLSAVNPSAGSGISAQKENQYLNQIANLQARIAELEKQYEQVAGFRSRYPFEGAKFITANVMKAAPTELVIDRGSKDQITSGLFVFGDNSIIGTISDADASTARVKLITSSSCKIEVEIAGAAAVLQGDGKSVKIKTLSRKNTVKRGDNVFCRPKAGFLNTPIIIGTVSDYKGGENAFQWDITIKPAANIAALTSVGVIKY